MIKLETLKNDNFTVLSEQSLVEVNGGLAITILGVTYVWAKAASILAGGGAILGGAAGWGDWVGYNESKRQ